MATVYWLDSDLRDGPEYVLTLHAVGPRLDYGRQRVAYELSHVNEDDPIFQGEDFEVCLRDPEGSQAAADLLGFLTLREGDTDPEYFDNDTPRQVEFRRNEAEYLYSAIEGLEEMVRLEEDEA